MKKSAKPQPTHPFYCYKKHCRKTAWETPEYLSAADWEIVRDLIAALEANSAQQLYNVLYRTLVIADDIFNHILGWPEGYTYCKELSYVENSALPGMRRHDLEKLKSALAQYNLTRGGK